MKSLLRVLVMCLLVAPAFAEQPFSLSTTPGLLPKDVLPRRYTIHLESDLKKGTFGGTVVIQIEVLKPVESIQLNAKHLEITDAILDGAGHLKPVFDAAQELVIFQLPKKLDAGKHDLRLDFRGVIDEKPDGLYRVDYSEAGKPASLLATQMEPADARSVFPCWDEPVFRAVFDLEVVVPEKFTAVSNMPVKAEKALPDGRKSVRFEATPAMSSYLLALVAGRLEKIDGEADGIPIHIYTTVGQGEQGRYALEVAEKILPYYHDYFGVRYPLPKLDMIAVPDKGDAMENWGAILYGENMLLYEEGKSSEYTRQTIFEFVAHEVAHQWFGNLVTMAWWDNLWLNEGFASWMATKATDHFNPGWQSWVRANDDKEGAMWLDAKRTTHPIQQPVKTVGEALDMFDGISYEKGQSFIRMLENFLGPDKFRAGLRDYMAAHAYSNTTTADLWAALEKASGQPVKKIAAAWTEQPGFPVIAMKLDCVDGKAHIGLSQERFTLGDAAQAPLQWTVPFTLGGMEKPATILITEKSAEAVLADCDAAFKGNAEDAGYYRVSYTPELAARLVANIGRLSAADRVNLLSDTWAMFAANRAPLEQYLNLAQALKSDPSLPVAGQIIGALYAIDDFLRGNSMREDFRKYARRIVRPQFDRLGWDAKKDEPPTDALLRTEVIGALGDWGDEKLIAGAKQRFKSFEVNPASLPGDLRYPVFRIVGREADKKTYATLRNLAANATGTEESRVLYSGLARARDADLAKETLELSKSDAVPPGTATRLVRWVAGDGEHPEMAWAFAEANFDGIQAKLGSLWGNDYFPQLATSLTSPDSEKELQRFAKKHLGLAEAAAVDRAIEDIRIEHGIKKRVIEQLPAILRVKK